MGFLRVALFLLVVTTLFCSGVWAGNRLRGPREPNVVRYSALLFGLVPLFLGAAIAACTFRVLELRGWQGNAPWVAAAFPFCGAILMTFIVMTAKITVTPDELIISPPLSRITRRIARYSVTSWNLNPQIGRIEINYVEKQKTKKEVFSLFFMEGEEIIFDFFESRISR